MSDANDFEDPVEFNFTEPTFDDFDIIVDDGKTESNEPEEFKELNREQLIAQIEANKLAAQEEAKQTGTTSFETQSVIDTLNKNLGQLTERMTPAQQAPVGPARMSPDELRAKIEELSQEDPSKAMDLFYQQKLAPEIGALMNQNLYHSEKYLTLDPERKDTARTYKAEIKDEVMKMNPVDRLRDPAIYERAHDTVVARHLNEVMEDRVGAAVEAKLKELGIGSEPKGDVKPPMYAEAGVERKPPPKDGVPRSEKLTQAEVNAIKQRAFEKNVSFDRMARTYIRNGRKLTR